MKLRLALGAIPLLIYPFVALADIMSLAASANAGGSIALKMAAFCFQISSLLYPLIYLGALIAAVSFSKQKKPAAITAATIPLWFLSLIGVLFIGWFVLDSKHENSRTRSHSQLRGVDAPLRG